MKMPVKLNIKRWFNQKIEIYLLVFGLFMMFFFFTSVQFQNKEVIGPFEFPEMNVPEGNELNNSRIELGRRLFYDPILSLDSTISCSSCHKQAFAFADNLSITPGVSAKLGNRNAPTLTNVGYNPTYLFDGFLTTLEKQALVPIEEHAEMNFNIVEVAKRMKRNKKYVQDAYRAYKREPDAYVITRALASFQRSLVSKNSKFDQYTRGKIKLTPSEKNGMRLFYDVLHCTQCHSGYNFTNFSVQNNGLNSTPSDSGRMRVTRLEIDRDLYKVPTLRNIALTAPYMHDGRLQTLREVILHYQKGGESHINKSKVIEPFKLNESELDDLISFLNTLTDSEFIQNKKYGNPFRN